MSFEEWCKGREYNADGPVILLALAGMIIAAIVAIAVYWYAVIPPYAAAGVRDAQLWAIAIPIWGTAFLIQPIGVRILLRPIKPFFTGLFMKPVKNAEFKLFKGMTGKEIYNEMHLHTSGETRQEVQTYLKNEAKMDNSLEKAQKILHRNLKQEQLVVVDFDIIDDKPYALVAQNFVKKISDSQNKESFRIRYTQRMFVAGINDEGYYFIHPLDTYWRFKETGLQGAPIANYEIDTDANPRDDNLRTLVDWMNRTYDGFTGRLQGDVLYKMVPMEPTVSKLFHHINLSIFDKEHSVSISSKSSFVVEDLGRHKVHCIGTISNEKITNNGHEIARYWIVEADKIVLTHPEHKTREIEIPAGHLMVIAAQDGRIPDRDMEPEGIIQMIRGSMRKASQFE